MRPHLEVFKGGYYPIIEHLVRHHEQDLSAMERITEGERHRLHALYHAEEDGR